MNKPSAEFPFAVFAGEFYYPLGGVNDLLNAYVTLEEAYAAAYAHEWGGSPKFYRDKREARAWAQILDIRTWEEHPTKSFDDPPQPVDTPSV